MLSILVREDSMERVLLLVSLVAWVAGGYWHASWVGWDVIMGLGAIGSLILGRRALWRRFRPR